MHNSIALILCIDCLDMSFNVDTVDTCMQQDKETILIVFTVYVDTVNTKKIPY